MYFCNLAELTLLQPVTSLIKHGIIIKISFRYCLCDFTNLSDNAKLLLWFHCCYLLLWLYVHIYMFKPLIWIKMCCNIIMLWLTSQWSSGGNILCIIGSLQSLNNIKSVCQSWCLSNLLVFNRWSASFCFRVPNIFKLTNIISWERSNKIREWIF